MKRPKGNFLLMRTMSAFDRVIISGHATRELAEAAMRKNGGLPNSVFQNGLSIVNVGPDSNMELVEVFEKWTVRPRS